MIVSFQIQYGGVQKWKLCQCPNIYGSNCIYNFCQQRQYVNENSILISLVWLLIHQQFISAFSDSNWAVLCGTSCASTRAHLIIGVGRDQRLEVKWNWPCLACEEDKKYLCVSLPYMVSHVEKTKWQLSGESASLTALCVCYLEMWKAAVIMCCYPAQEHLCQISSEYN